MGLTPLTHLLNVLHLVRVHADEPGYLRPVPVQMWQG